ncbi:hypothetical protein EI555_007310, partial [Monodon monoceros]
VKQGQSDLLLPHSPDGPAAPQRRVLCHRGAPRALLRSAPPGHQTLPQGSEGEGAGEAKGKHSHRHPAEETRGRSC